MISPRFRRGIAWVGTLLAAGSAVAIYAAAQNDWLVRSAEPASSSEGSAQSAAAPSPTAAETKKKERLVILGSGWGAVSLLRHLDQSRYDVVVISPRNYFLFTPLLPSVTVGTLESQSVIVPMRTYLSPSSRFLKAMCTEIDPDARTVTCKPMTDTAISVDSFTVPYDKLVVAVGSINNTFGTPGVYENCLFLKEASDAERIRRRILNLFEAASIPGLSEDERRKLLSFVVVGGGPTGVEFAAELSDFIRDDLLRAFPLARDMWSITLVELLDHILSFYDRQVSDYTEKHFRRESINIQTNRKVVSVAPGSVLVQATDTKREEQLPFGLCVWSTGIGPAPLVKQLQQRLKHTQTNARALLTNEHLEVLGTAGVYALGDCATVYQPRLLDRLVELFRDADTNRDGKISLKELERMVEYHQRRYPQLAEYGRRMPDLFRQADTDGDGLLDEGEFRTILQIADSRMKALPATAQVAAQQGQFIASVLNHEREPHAVFSYKHFGSLAYVGSDTAVADFGGKVLSGVGAWWLWRSVYWSKQFSLRNKMYLSFDWLRTLIFGRDVSVQ